MAKHVLNLVNRAYELFLGSEVEEKRQLVSLVLSNLKLDAERLVYDVEKPFDVIINSSECQLWRPMVDTFINEPMPIGISLQYAQTVCGNLGVQIQAQL